MLYFQKKNISLQKQEKKGYGRSVWMEVIEILLVPDTFFLNGK